jgi:hypothetical protein
MLFNKNWKNMSPLVFSTSLCRHATVTIKVAGRRAKLPGTIWPLTPIPIQACPSLILRHSIFLRNSTPQCTHADSCLLPFHTPLKMAAAIKAINAKIRSNKVLDYFCSTRKLLSPTDHSLSHHPRVRFAFPKVFVSLVLLLLLES